MICPVVRREKLPMNIDEVLEHGCCHVPGVDRTAEGSVASNVSTHASLLADMPPRVVIGTLDAPTLKLMTYDKSVSSVCVSLML